MISRRTALKTLALSGAATWASAVASAQTPAPAAPAAPAAAPPPAAEPEGVFKLPPLGYDYDALEPYIDAETMKIHHDKHHAAYVSKLNQAIAKAPALGKRTIEDLLANLDTVPEEIRADVRNQGGGHANHSLFWQILKKTENGKPVGALAKSIETGFGSYDDFWKLLSAAAMGVFGSGWAWVVWREKKLVIERTANQDSPLTTGGIPLLGLDVWEHAYYLKNQNRRADYIEAWWNVVNWDFVAASYKKALT
jgi:Fe-Mn family superoxide dismutase